MTQNNKRVEGGSKMKRRDFLKAAAGVTVCASLPKLTMGKAAFNSNFRLFPTDLAGAEWVQFPATGFSKPVCGVIYRLEHKVTNGLALGGIGTGCLDLETSGLLGYNTMFNTHVPRRGPDNVPLLGLSVGGKTWVLCDPTQIKHGSGYYQPKGPSEEYTIWKEKGYVHTKEPFLPYSTQLKFEGLGRPNEIHYWGHYPVADLEFELDGPVSIGLRAWAPFIPGDVMASTLPGIIFEVHVRNNTRQRQSGVLAFSFPGPAAQEAGADRFQKRHATAGMFHGVAVDAPLASYAVGIVGEKKARFGGELGADKDKWLSIATALPETHSGHSGSSVAVDFSLKPHANKIVKFLVSWFAPTWNAGGYNWAGAEHTFTHMYARYYPSALHTAEILARDEAKLLKRVLAWQQVIYSERQLPVWLRDSLVNVLYLLTEDSLWAQAKPPVPSWVKPEQGLFGLNECPRGGPQIECLPCSFYGNQPLIYFFPELALSTLRGYKGYQLSDGAPPWIFGGCTGNSPPIEFVNATAGYQFATNGISLAAMIDRYYLCHGKTNENFVREFYPVLKQCLLWTMNLRTTASYSIGEKLIAMPSADSKESEMPPREWFEVPEPGWAGMTAHLGGLRLAQLRIMERFARLAGDEAFAHQCRLWIKAAAETMETRLWNGRYYLNYFEPDTGRRSDLIFGYQLDGEWITDHHGLPSALPVERVRTVLETVKQANVKVSKHGAVNYANADGTPAQVKGYGTYSYFPPEVLMLAMNFMYEGQMEFGLELARKTWHNLVCLQRYTWDLPNIMRGDADTGERTYGSDYYQDLMLWSLAAAIAGKDFGTVMKSGGLVERILRAGRP